MLCWRPPGRSSPISWNIILNFKTEKEVNAFIEAEKETPNQPATKTTNVLVTNFLQMVEVTDEYLDVEGVRQVLKTAFQTLSQKYVTYLLLRTGKQKGDVEILIDKLKFLRKYFPEEYEKLQEEVPS